MGEIRALRATFEDVLDNQEMLREKLDNLIQENRPIRDKRERDEFFRLVARSTLGVTSHGTGHEIEFRVEKDGVHILGNVEKVAGWIAYQNERTVTIPGSKPISVEIKDLWLMLRDHFLNIFPRALNEAVKVSVEREGGVIYGGVRGEPKSR